MSRVRIVKQGRSGLRSANVKMLKKNAGRATMRPQAKRGGYLWKFEKHGRGLEEILTVGLKVLSRLSLYGVTIFLVSGQAIIDLERCAADGWKGSSPDESPRRVIGGFALLSTYLPSYLGRYENHCTPALGLRSPKRKKRQLDA